ncbi:hypothetical protein VFPBJ_04533 [Purpureocillium lilacinum]|uniref:Uncharacterized protein n=1 Tax=Purpureocillium lilacinum TaxID=33203 RepID=A0A179GXU3_PURLI|nr:hypothetical protein VFPBJ_04533 [Purpureocillium lilacinum]
MMQSCGSSGLEVPLSARCRDGRPGSGMEAWQAPSWGKLGGAFGCLLPATINQRCPISSLFSGQGGRGHVPKLHPSGPKPRGSHCLSARCGAAAYLIAPQLNGNFQGCTK